MISKGKYIAKYIVNMRYVAKLYNVSKSSVSNWFRLYENKKLGIILSHKYRRTKLTNNIATYIKKYIKRNPCFNCIKLISNIKRTYNVTIGKSTIYKYLRNNGYSKKKIIKKKHLDTHKQKEKIKKFKQTIKNISINEIISIDEVSFDTDITNDYGWGKKRRSFI